jgi:hypothetical protein
LRAREDVERQRREEEAGPEHGEGSRQPNGRWMAKTDGLILGVGCLHFIGG